MIRFDKFRVLVFLTCGYALFIFFLSSLSSPPSPHDIGFLREFMGELMGLFEDNRLKFLLSPLYIAYLHPDKFAHVVLYMVLGLLLNRTLSCADNAFLKRYPALFAIFIGTLYGVTDEFHQMFVPYRTSSSIDLFADFLGLLFVQLLIVFYSGIIRLLSKEYERH
ncbi:MAG: VanZ like family protein [Candidatus Argoarchaeum ethanivorans]|uniref:VanZ like family protein n=1 Tax=Candidatus Argoarchaeum ethanivorans TaxID=2608793 RepID=A0A811T8X6_9EURY|nr:MAG: VanZ like family protein [Candidatus Argoarchaeum ethanivorans]